MYMYYFLGFQVAGEQGKRFVVEDEKSEECREKEAKDRKERYKKGQNIFLLGILMDCENYKRITLNLFST